jgi:hypothetical protein
LEGGELLIPKLNRVFKYACNGKYSQKDIKRLISKVMINKENGCWEYIGPLCRQSGYGHFACNGKTYLSHRVSYEIFIGKIISRGIYVCHKCDNRKCINPDHLFLGTQKDNMKDMSNKGRRAVGEKNGASKLTWERVNNIRKLWNTGKYTQRQLSKESQVVFQNVSFIIMNKTWYDRNYKRTYFENKGTSKLNWEKVNKIRKLWLTNKYTQTQLGKMFNVVSSVISRIVNNKIWIV